jgi:16S rRNA (uracil1498-N3)-methyltransferase
VETEKEIILPKIIAHQVNHVLRMRKGQSIIVFNGHGGQYLGEIHTLEKKLVSVILFEYQDIDLEPSLHITLEQGVSRGQHMDYTIQKAVELGVSTIHPVYTEFGNVKLNADRQEKRVQHWQKIIISACEQCGRNKLPEIKAPAKLSEHITGHANGPARFILSPYAKQVLQDCVTQTSPVSLLCGPEGGFSDSEVIDAEQSGYMPVKLGPRIMRTETASIAGIVAIQTLWGDMT